MLELTDPDDPRLFAFRICLQQIAGALGLGPSAPPTPMISSEDQSWIAYVVDLTAEDLDRQGADNVYIAQAKAGVRECLTLALEIDPSRENALGLCEGYDVYTPSEGEADPEAEPEPEPEPELQPEPEPEPEPEPPPPVQASLSVVSSSATFDQCDPVFTGVCFYDIEITLSYVSPTPTSEVKCGGGFTQTQDKQQVSQQSGAVSLTIQQTVQRDTHSGELLTANPVTVRCRLLSNVSIEVDIDVLLPPLAPPS